MKKFITLILFAAIAQISFAQTVLHPGDIAIVQVNKDYESFNFVPLVPITTGTKIIFSDMKYSATQRGFIPFGNPQYTGIHEFTATQNYAAGTVIQSTSANLLESKKVIFTNSEGNTLIAFQVNATDTTYLTALGWFKAVNFKAGVSDIPPGLSVANNTVVKFDSTETYFNRNYYYTIKFDNMGDASKQEGTAIQLRRRFADVANYTHSNSVVQYSPVPNFNVLAPDLVFPTLVSSNPTKNKINVSPYGAVKLKFSEPMIAKNAITIRNTQTNATQYIIPANVTIKDTIVSFSYGTVLDYATNYTMEFQPGTFTDLDNNPWPAMGDTIIPFATSAKRGQIDMRFMPPGTILLTPFTDLHYYKRDDIHWTTQSTYDDYGNEWWKGFFSFNMFGLPYRWYGNVLPTSYSNNTPNMSDEQSPVKGYLWMQGATSKVVVDLTGIDNTITNITSTVYDNNCAVEARYYFGGVYRNSYKQIVSTPVGKDNQKIHFENINTTKLDSIVFSSLEGNIQRVFIELIDLQVPIVELGANRTICEGDSVKLDGGFTPGAVYDWSTNEHSKSIWVKNTGNYSLTVKNTLGQRSDNVSVTVKPKLTVSLPDTIYACVGDTVTLTAGTDISNSYFWTPNGQTTPSIKVTKSGIYHVLVNNGFGGCFTTDSTRVIFKGAKVRLYNYQGGSYGSGDVKGQLYRKNSTAKFELYREMDMLDFVQLDSLAAGDYIFKMHFVGYSFVGQNPWMDTYHDGKTEWKKVTPFKLTCETDSMIGFLIANKPSFVFNGTGVISGKVNINGQPVGSPMHRAKANVNVDCETRVVLYNATGDIIATTCPDSNGNYSFTNLPAGNYTVGIERTGFEVQSVFTTTVTAGATISNADFTINQAEQTVIQGISTGISNTVVGNSLKLIPNPAVNTTMLEFDLATDSKVTISVSDLMGRVIQKDIRLLSSGKNRIPLAVDNLSGIFIVKVSTVVGYSIARLIVQ
jgi:hypothetical protein